VNRLVSGGGGRPARAVAAAFLALGVAAVAGCGSSHHATPPASTTTTTSSASQLDGLIPTPLPVKPSFTLRDTAGRPYSFLPSTRGKLTYLFFGYTHCPDACPATMSALSYALRLQPTAVRKRIDVVFVTVDPRRDTGPVIRTWLDHFSTSFVGLTGTIDQISAVEQEAGVPPAPKVPGKGVNYEVTHSSILFAYSPDGRAHVVYAQGFKPTAYAHDMPLLLQFT